MLQDGLSVSLSTFTLVSLAEIGDKSQLVCMTLAARHRHMPVFWGASFSFILLNILAVVFGASIASWLPEQLILAVVMLLFGGFGVYSLVVHAEESGEINERAGRNIFITTFLMIFVAELGDKTQIAVATLASSFAPIAVWLGASAALILISGLGVWAGRTFFAKLPVYWLQKISGVIFLIFAALAAWQMVLSASSG